MGTRREGRKRDRTSSCSLHSHGIIVVPVLLNSEFEHTRVLHGEPLQLPELACSRTKVSGLDKSCMGGIICQAAGNKSRGKKETYPES